MAAPTTARIVDPSGNTLLTLANDQASYILNELDLGFPSVRAVSQPNPGRNGDVDTSRFVGARSVTARVTVSATNTGPLVDTLAGLMHPQQRNYLQASRADWAAERRIVVHGETFACPPGAIRVAQLGFRAPLGLWEDVAAITVTIQPSGSSTGGFSFPLVFPLAMTPGQASGSTMVALGGSVAAPVLWRLYGPVTSPIVRRADTGEQLSFPGLVINQGDYLQIDQGAKTVLLNGLLTASLYNRLDFAGAAWWRLPSNATTGVSFTGTAIGPTTSGVLTVRNRWM